MEDLGDFGSGIGSGIGSVFAPGLGIDLSGLFGGGDSGGGDAGGLADFGSVFSGGDSGGGDAGGLADFGSGFASGISNLGAGIAADAPPFNYDVFGSQIAGIASFGISNLPPPGSIASDLQQGATQLLGFYPAIDLSGIYDQQDKGAVDIPGAQAQRVPVSSAGKGGIWGNVPSVPLPFLGPRRAVGASSGDNTGLLIVGAFVLLIVVLATSSGGSKGGGAGKAK